MSDWEAIQRADTRARVRGFLGYEPPKPTFAEVLADPRPLDQFMTGAQKERARILQMTRPLDFKPGAAWDETTLAGREALMLELGFTP